ncbi:MAG: homoserine dehydrogenase, partial [Phycisphaerales bacterium JB064]
MCAGLIVLKFGGSVLTDEHRLRIAVHEIYRWRREGWRVAAVVSAFAGRTDELLASCSCDGLEADPHAAAAILACGERESAAKLAGCLDRVGVQATVLDPAAIGLCAQGAALDAHPLGFDTHKVREALEAVGVVVVPGFIAVDEQGRTVTFGRGGSDLTALVLADGLEADRCRLVKDVDGLYERDPASSGPPPRRFERASYEDVLRLDGSIVQHKAVRFARDHGLR